MVLFALLGCAKLTTLEIEERATTTVEQGTLLEELLGDFGFESFVTMDLTASQEMQNQGAGPGDVEDVELVYFELEAMDPEGADLSFIDSLDVLVEAPDLDPVLLATADDFPEGQAVVPFTLSDVDLTPYVVSQSMTLTTDVSAHRPEVDTTVEARFQVNVRVTAQGVRNNL